MAHVTPDQSTGTSEAPNLPNTIPIQDSFSTRIKDVEFKVSSKGNSMMVLDVEAYHPDLYKVGSKTYNIAGVLNSKLYLVFTDKGMERVWEMMDFTGIGRSKGIDTDNPDTEQFKSKTFFALWGSEEYVIRKLLSEEEKLAGKKPEEADPVLDANGNPMKGYRRVCKQL